MAYNNGLLNFGDSYVEVGYDNEDYSVDKAQIVEKDGTVHELGGGGGGGELSTAEINFVANSDSKYARLEGIFIVRDEEYGDWMTSDPTVTDGDILAAVLLNGTADINISKEGITDVTANGAEITSDESYYYATITTACTITITFNS